MKDLKTITEKTRNNKVEKIGATNAYIDALIIAREVDDRKTENLIIKLLKMQGTRIDWVERQYV